VIAELLAAVTAWQTGPPLPVARTEVAGAAVRGEIYVVGGYNADGSSSRRVDVYSPAKGSWRRGPDLPIAVNHAMAAAYGGKLYVVGGYSASGTSRSAFVLSRGKWRALAPLPVARAAAGAAVARAKLYIVGGVRRPGSLARVAFVFDLSRGRWNTIQGSTPREHLAAAALKGKVYAVAGRLGGIDTNQTRVEVFTGNWRPVAPLPEARGGTGAAAVAGRIVSVGGEAPPGTIASVYAYLPASRRWQKLPDLLTPRHGLAVVALGTRVYVIGGGPRPGLFVSDANESLDLRR
jgi:non-specific serine/threonine protein kinase